MWDVVIIGAGPAATSAAINVTNAGCSCLLVEREQFPRYRPGETLHPGIEPLLRHLRTWNSIEVAGLLRHKGVMIETRTESRFEQFGGDERGSWFGLQASRAKLDAALMERARQQGARLLMPCRVHKVLCEGGRVIGVETDCGLQRSRFVIDAGGGRHLLAKDLSLGPVRCSPRLLARFGYVSGDVEYIHENPLLKMDSSGWTWISRVGENLIQWTRLNVSRRDRPTGNLRILSGDEPPELESDFPSELAGLKAVGRICGADVTWRRVTKSAGLGFFITGDAACVLDPATSDGVIRAIMSGMLAGHLIAQVIRKTEIEAAAIAQYSGWISDLFKHEVVRLAQVYDQAFPGWRNRSMVG